MNADRETCPSAPPNDPERRKRSRRRLCAEPRSGGILVRACVLAVFLAAGLILVWMLGLSVGVRMQLESRTGLPIAVESATGNPFAMTYRISGAKIGSADAGDASPFLSIVHARLELNSPSKAVPFWRVEEATLEIDKLVWTIDESGRASLGELERRIYQSFGAAPGETDAFFRKLILKVGEIEVLDFSRPVPRRARLAGGFEVETANVSGLAEALQPYVTAAYR